MNGGQYVSVNVTAGMFYTFQTCGSSTFDSQITVYDNGGFNVLGYNDDACGLQSMVSYNCQTSGTVNVLLDEYNCMNTGACMDLTIDCSTALVLDSTNLPIVVINTIGGVQIPNQPKVDATMGVIYNGEGNMNHISDPYNEYYGNIGIEIRGSSSQMFPKKQYGFETRDPQGEPFDVTFFNMAYDNDWVLFAPYSDKSLMRNYLAYDMGWDCERWAPRTKFCEVFINGSYEGVYIFTERIKRKDGKVGTNDVEPDENSGNELTGDYIFKVDKTTSGGVIAWTSPYPPYNSTATIGFQMHDPELDSLTATQLNYIQNYVTTFEGILAGPNFDDPVNGFRAFADAESFIDFMLVNEVSKNVDGYRISTFLHKLRVSEGGKLIAGPLWDFNLAYGNANYCQGGQTSGWEIYFNQVCGGSLVNPFWWERMLQDTEFAHLTNCRYKELRQGPWNTDSLMQKIDSVASFLDDAQQRNFQRWPILGTYVWPNNFIGNTYQEEINYLKTWLTDRLTWMDQNMFGTCTDLGVEQLQTSQITVSPNPTSSYVEFHSNIPINDGTIEILDIDGKIILQNSINGAGKAVNLSGFETGMYYYKILNKNGIISSGKILKTN